MIRALCPVLPIVRLVMIWMKVKRFWSRAGCPKIPAFLEKVYLPQMIFLQEHSSSKVTGPASGLRQCSVAVPVYILVMT